MSAFLVLFGAVLCATSAGVVVWSHARLRQRQQVPDTWTFRGCFGPLALVQFIGVPLFAGLVGSAFEQGMFGFWFFLCFWAALFTAPVWGGCGYAMFRKLKPVLGAQAGLGYSPLPAHAGENAARANGRTATTGERPK